MKALKIQEIIGMDKNRKFALVKSHTQEELIEAIAELEELQNRSCSSCGSIYYDDIENYFKCHNDISDDVTFLHGEAVIRTPNDFWCKFYKKRDIE